VNRPTGVFLPAQLAAEPGIARTAAKLTQSFRRTLAQHLADRSLTTPIPFLAARHPPPAAFRDSD